MFRAPPNRLSSTRAAICIAFGLNLSACTVLTVEPPRPSVAKLADGLTWSDAYAYLNSAKDNIKAGQSQVDQLNKASLAGVGIGAAGAAATTLARGPKDAVLGLMTIGGISYAVNQTLTPQDQSAIYKAGLDRLACVERAGYTLHRSVGSNHDLVSLKKIDLLAAAKKVAVEISEARRFPSDTDLATVRGRAETALLDANVVLVGTDKYLAETDVPFEVYMTVERVVLDLNDQLRQKAPKADDVAKLGTSISSFQKARSAELEAAFASAPASGASAAAIASAEFSALAKRLNDDTEDLKQLVNQVRSMVPTVGYATTETIRACVSTLPVQGRFIAKPNGPFRLVAGGDPHTLSIDTDATTLEHAFIGVTPSAQNLLLSNPSAGTYSLAAPQNAREASYQLFFHRRGDLQQLGPTFDINVVAAEAPAITASSPAPSSSSSPASKTTTKPASAPTASNGASSAKPPIPPSPPVK